MKDEEAAAILKLTPFSKMSPYNGVTIYDVINLCSFVHIWADALIVCPCEKFRCNMSTKKEDWGGGGGECRSTSLQHLKKPSPITVKDGYNEKYFEIFTG